MPELPEVEIVTQGLRKSINHKIIAEAEKYRDNIRFPIPADLPTILQGAKITNIIRRARYILISLSNAKTLIIHLGMTGKLVYYSSGTEFIKQKHDHVLIKFTDESYIVYNDPRRFGVVDVCDNCRLAEHQLLKTLAVEPFSEEFTAEYLLNKLKGKKLNIKTSLMDNKVVVGIGNIYICESLHISGISPLRPANSISLSELKALIGNVQKVLKQSIVAGGSSISDYVNSDGNEGHFQDEFLVYGRKDLACKKCGGMIKKIVQNGRGTYYCEHCQK